MLRLGQGFAPYILNSINQVAGTASPERKLQVPGLTNYLMTRSPSQKSMVDLNTANGQERTVRVRMKQRLAAGHIESGAVDCDQTNVIPVSEVDVDVNTTRWVSLFRTDQEMRRFTEESIRTQSVGAPAAPIQQELVDDIMAAANQLIQEIDIALMTQVTTAFGVNRRTGVATSTAINFNRNSTTNPLTDGEIRILTDWSQNQAVGRPAVIGAGNYYAWILQQGAKSANEAGIDTRFFANQVDFFYDLNADTQFGANQVAIVEDGSLHMVEFFENMGAFSGERPGQSFFFTLNLPMMRGNEVVPMKFDAQLRYEDCPSTKTDGYYGTSLSLGRGWQIIISKQVGLFTFGDAAYRATDVLNGNTGVYRYTINNNCETC